MLLGGVDRDPELVIRPDVMFILGSCTCVFNLFEVLNNEVEMACMH